MDGQTNQEFTTAECSPYSALSLLTRVSQCDPEALRKVVQTRNYLTHFDPGLSEKAATGNALYDLKEQLKFLLEISLLQELGIPEDLREKIVMRHQAYLWFRHEYRKRASSPS